MSPSRQALLIGALALQGAYDAHVRMLAALGATSRLVRLPEDLIGLDGLILPGGESTTMLQFLDRNGFFEVLQTYVKSTPTFGTCAGAILLAARVEGPAQRSLGALDITVERNAFGRQRDSSILTELTSLGDPPLEMVFIRAPRITRTGPKVEVLASRDGFPCLVRSGLILAATFHPELSSDRRVHQLFLTVVRQNLADATRKRR
jgi:5'-phosphate synthase pdxT subunit